MRLLLIQFNFIFYSYHVKARQYKRENPNNQMAAVNRKSGIGWEERSGTNSNPGSYSNLLHRGCLHNQMSCSVSQTTPGFIITINEGLLLAHLIHTKVFQQNQVRDQLSGLICWGETRVKMSIWETTSRLVGSVTGCQTHAALQEKAKERAERKMYKIWEKSHIFLGWVKDGEMVVGLVN